MTAHTVCLLPSRTFHRQVFQYPISIFRISQPFRACLRKRAWTPRSRSVCSIGISSAMRDTFQTYIIGIEGSFIVLFPARAMAEKCHNERSAPYGISAFRAERRARRTSVGHSPTGISQRYLSMLVLRSGPAMRSAQRAVSKRIVALLGQA